MIVAAVDTNVLASGFVNAGGIPGRILRSWTEDRFVLVVSEEIIDELTRTFEDPYFAARLTPEQRAKNIALLRAAARIEAATVPVAGVATHPEDDVILSLAVSANVEYLVTGDNRLRRHVPSFRGVTLVSPREFLELLESPAS